MQKIKNYYFIVLMFLSGASLHLSAQNIYWVESAFDSPQLVKSDTSGSVLLSKSLTAGSQPQNIALDLQNNQLYWTGLSFTDAQINKISADFSTSTVVIDQQTVSRGIAIDPVNEKIYWTSTNLVDGPKIWQADLNGQSKTVLIDFGSASNNTPRSIALDIDAQKMYWANFGAGKIQRADMTIGASVEDLLSGLNGPSGIAVDADSGKIYWTEMNGHQIKLADLDGNNIGLLVDSLSYPNSISVNNIANRMAWTEMGTGKIKSAALDGSDIFEYNVSAVAPTGIIIEPLAPVSGDLAIVPADTILQVHNYLQFDAQIVDTHGVAHPTEADWYVKRHRVGPITNDGLLFSYFPGYSKIMAKRDSMVAKARLTVVDTTADSSGVNKIKMVAKFPWGGHSHYKILKEGEMYLLGGLPFPFNIIFGSKLYFPNGSLHEDITIEVELPQFCKIRGDSIDFVDRIVNGIKFNVFAGDSLVEPYYFDKSVSISIPYNRGILRRHKIDPERLSLFYAIDSTTFDSLGISHVMVDTANTRIYALVEHFSSLVVREKVTVTSIKNDHGLNVVPGDFELKQNYPNPFNPKTTINYQLPVSSDVDLSIYNILGQKVATLVSKEQTAGSYNIEWDATGFASGVYVYKLETNKGFIGTRKLLLLK